MGAMASMVAKKAVEFAKADPPIKYSVWDCQRAVEEFVRAAGGILEFRGSNDMARNAGKLWTLAEGKALGKLVPGAMLFICTPKWGIFGPPARYADGKGNFEHVGVYVGEKALRDVDKHGKERWCNVVHSSATMKRVCGSAVANGWTHVMWFDSVDYGETNVEAMPVEKTMPTIRRRSKGSAVMEAQERLMALGYALEKFGADGQFGAETLEAVKAFQGDKGLKVDGIIGPLTWEKLM